MIVNTIDSWLPGVKLFRGSLLKNLKDDLFFCYNQTGNVCLIFMAGVHHQIVYSVSCC
jgi:hypothetical protein